MTALRAGELEDFACGHAWQVLHPPRQAHAEGWLEVGDGHALHWERCGHPGAPAALFLHGGPGAGCTPQDRRWFDPQQWQAVLFDQRGCGLSRARDALQANTTDHLVADIEALREHLGIDDWLLFGGSWGATLALAYAQAHPRRVRGLVLRGVFLATRAETAWLYGAGGAARRHPAAWQRLCDAASMQPGQALLDAMQTALQADAPAALAAARAWLRWESDLMAAEGPGPGPGALPDHGDAAQALRAARIGVHYARAGWFLDEGRLLRDAERLQDLPGVIVQGARDLVTPPAAARALHARWPAARLQELPGAGHASTQPRIARQLIEATAALARSAGCSLAEETPDVRH